MFLFLETDTREQKKYEKRIQTSVVNTVNGLRYEIKFENRVKDKSNFFIKVGLSPSKKDCVICFNESPLKMMKNAFYFILKSLFVLKVFKFLS